MTAELVCAATDRGDWIKARRTGVTATDIVTILGLGASSEYALYWEKLGKLPPWEGNARTALGLILQPYVQMRWADEHAEVLFGHDELYRSPERPWQLATPDGFVAAPGTSGPTVAIWEGKTWDDHDRAAWEDGMPPKVRAQVLWQMDTLGVGTGHVGVLFLPSGEFESRTIKHQDLTREPDAAPGARTAESDGPKYGAGLGQDVGLDPASCDLCADVAYMRQVGEAFWARVREGLPPFPDGSPATLAAVKALHPGEPAGTVEIDAQLCDDLIWARTAKQDAERGVRAAEAALRVAMGDAQFGTVEGEPVVKRTCYEVAGKTIERKAYTVDKLTRLGARNGDSDE